MSPHPHLWLSLFLDVLPYILFPSSSQPSRSPSCFFITPNALSLSMSFIKSEPQHWGNVSLMLLGMFFSLSNHSSFISLFCLFTPPFLIHCERNWAALFRVLKKSKRELSYLAKGLNQINCLLLMCKLYYMEFQLASDDKKGRIESQHFLNRF